MAKDILILVTVLVAAVGVRANAEDHVDFQQQIQPIFLEYCAKCHGEAKGAGHMRLHTVDAVQEKLQADSQLLVPGDPEKSQLYQRLVLPADDHKRMPKRSDPLPKEKIVLIANWIKQGAVLPISAAAAEPAHAASSDKPKDAATPAKPAEPPLPEVAAAPKEAIDRLTAAGAQVTSLCAGSELLQVSFAHGGRPTSDADIAPLAGVADQVYTLDLSEAKVTAAGLATLAALKNLSALHLERSAVTDDGLAHLTGLQQLQYLNLCGTAITDAGLSHLINLKQLKKLYLWQTQASYDAATGLEKGIPGLTVNLGYDNPAVLRARLTKQLESAKKRVEDAKSKEQMAQQQLDGAKKNVEAGNAQVADLEKQVQEMEEKEHPTNQKGDSPQPSNPTKPDETKPDQAKLDDAPSKTPKPEPAKP